MADAEPSKKEAEPISTVAGRRRTVQGETHMHSTVIPLHTDTPPKSVRVWMESSRREMREDRPARLRQKKKAMARNRPPPPMCWKSTGILYYIHTLPTACGTQ